MLISIHAPSRGRRWHPVLCRGYGDFNPRPLTGATHYDYIKVYTFDISIHAPSRGRLIPMNPTRIFCIFQSTPPHGGDGTYTHKALSDLRFQSTPPHGGDYRRQCWWHWKLYFNPRPLTGATSVAGVSGRSPGNFNPRPLTGATT